MLEPSASSDFRFMRIVTDSPRIGGKPGTPSSLADTADPCGGAQRGIGLVFQEFELLEYLSVLDNILLPYRINPSLRYTPDVGERAARLADQVGIGDKLRRHPDRLSQGERQRVAVCRAVLPQPRLLLADEPTGNLDPVNAARVLDILFDYAGDSGATFVAVTHDQSLVSRFAQTIDMKRFLP